MGFYPVIKITCAKAVLPGHVLHGGSQVWYGPHDVQHLHHGLAVHKLLLKVDLISAHTLLNVHKDLEYMKT